MTASRPFHLLLLLLSFIPSALPGQTFTYAPHRFGVNLFAGGIDTPRFQFVDIDADGDLDLFLLDRDGVTTFFRGQAGTYTLEPASSFGLSFGAWFRFADIDADGDQDCFTSGDFSDVRLYLNTGTAASPQFQWNGTTLKDTAGTELMSERFSVPTLADIDADGDLDLFTGSQSGSVTLYTNTGTPHAPAFAFTTAQFGGILIVGGGLRKPLHGASGIEFFDADSNGTLDLFWGDYFNPSLYAVKNTGTPHAPVMALTDSTYPKEEPVSTFGFNIPQHVDLDGDGVTDLVTASVFPTESYDTFWRYRNIGTNAQPYYELQTKNLLTMLDAGARASVAAADFDGDGDTDLCIASAGGEIRIHANSGTVTQPHFSSVPDHTMKVPDLYLTVAARDMNFDGSPDLLIGGFSGTLRFYRNVPAGAPFTFSPQSFPLDAAAFGNSAAPAVGDADGDAVPDVVVGNSAGVLAMYKGTVVNGAYTFTAVPGYFAGIDVGNEAMPFITDIDADGRSDLFIGNSDGRVARYEFDPAAGKFSAVTSSFASVDLRVNASPCFTDIDADGDADLFLGSGKGGVCFYENTGPSSVRDDVTVPVSPLTLFPNYPNPFNPVTTIPFFLSEDAYIRAEVFTPLGSAAGELVRQPYRAGHHSVRWNAAGLPSGTYFVRFTVHTRHGLTRITAPMLFIK